MMFLHSRRLYVYWPGNTVLYIYVFSYSTHHRLAMEIPSTPKRTELTREYLNELVETMPARCEALIRATGVYTEY